MAFSRETEFFLKSYASSRVFWLLLSSFSVSALFYTIWETDRAAISLTSFTLTKACYRFLFEIPVLKLSRTFLNKALNGWS